MNTQQQIEYEFRVDGAGVAVTWGGETLVVEPADLRDGGWVERVYADEHCGHDLDAAYDEGHRAGVADSRGELTEGQGLVIERWHNENHAGVMRFCYEQPCRDLRGDTHS